MLKKVVTSKRVARRYTRHVIRQALRQRRTK